MLTEAQLARIEARHKAATPNPVLIRYKNGGGRLANFSNDTSERTLVADFYHDGDREFYTAALADIPALTAEVRRLRDALEGLLDEQNGVPLLSRTKQYRAAYAAACECLGRTPTLPRGWES